MATVILESETYRAFKDLTILDYVLMSLASFRIIRLVVYDKIFAFFREQFLDISPTKTKITFIKPPHGPRRTIADLLSCPWCFGVWATAMVTFFYLLTPYAFYPVLLLAISSVASFLQITANLVGWKAENLKIDAESRM
jgi:hypothetical protein